MFDKLRFTLGGWNVSMKWWMRRKAEDFRMAVAWHTPRWLIYWCAIRLMAHATTGPYGSQVVPDLTCLDALKRWDDRHDKDRRRNSSGFCSGLDNLA